MDIRKVPDWRIRHAFQAEELPEDQIIIRLVPTETKMWGTVNFPEPSAVRLPLNAAIRAAREAERLKAALSFLPVAESDTLDMKLMRSYFDYFEQAMIAATFSFQALEAFCNEIIADSGRTTSGWNETGRRGLWTVMNSRGKHRLLRSLERSYPQFARSRRRKGRAIGVGSMI